MRPTARRAAPAPPLAVLAALLAACANGPTPPDAGAPRSARAAAWAGDTLHLPFGATAELPGGARLTFVARGADSRCPIDALCVWEGDAAITVRVAGASGAGERTLRTNPRFAADTLTAGATALRLFGLVPAPRASGPAPDAADYAALFVVARR
jgi:hypothetical protein